MPSKQDNQGWPFSNEGVARDAGIIPPDPTSDQGFGMNPGVDSGGMNLGGMDPDVTPPEEFVSAITTTIDRDAVDEEPTDTVGADTVGADTVGADGTKTQPTEPVTRPDIDHPVKRGDYPFQPEATRASGGPDQTGYQNDADPPR